MGLLDFGVQRINTLGEKLRDYTSSMPGADDPKPGGSPCVLHAV